ERHLRRMRTLYDKRRRALVRALQAQFGERAMVLGENSGMHLMVRMKTTLSNDEVARRAMKAGGSLNDARIYYLSQGGNKEFVLGYAGLSERKIQEGIKRLAKILH